MDMRENPPGQEHHKISWRALAFPFLLHFWPLLLIMSQKALMPLGLLLVGSGDKHFRRDLLIAIAMLIFGALTLLLQQTNEFAVSHYMGYALFVLSVPLINYAAANDRPNLIKGLAILSLLNSLMAIVVYFSTIDLSIFRGLNRIVGDDGETHRVYYETTSLLAVLSLQFIRSKSLRYACIAVLAFYALFLAKSVFVILLILLNIYLHRLLQGTLLRRITTIVIIVFTAIIGPIIVAVLREDVTLSLGIKLFQFNEILEDPSSIIFGSGWGYIIESIVNSPDQEYQVEMQLPMLFRQIGWFGVLSYVTGMFLLIRSASTNLSVATLRWLTYLAIGFNNPWLFLPSWYMTACLMHSQFDKNKMTVDSNEYQANPTPSKN